MKKRQLLWMSTATVLVALLVITGCARGPLSVLFPKREAAPPLSVPEPPTPTTYEPPGEIVEAPVPPVEEPAARGITFEPSDLGMIHFEFDKSRITEEARIVLERNAEVLKENPGVMVQIEGHCDERGTNEYNVALGQRRARSTRDYLIKLGVDPNTVVTISYGEERPLDPRHNEEAWAQNRRAQFRSAVQ